MATISTSFPSADAGMPAYHSLVEKEAPKTVSIKASALSCVDFKCSNTWVIATKPPLHPDGTPTLVYEKSSGRVFWNKNDSTVRINSCVNLLMFIPIVLPYSLFYSAQKIVKLTSCYHFWFCLNKTKEMMVFSLPPKNNFSLHQTIPEEVPSVTASEFDEQTEDEDVMLDVNMNECITETQAPSPQQISSSPVRITRPQFVHNSPNSLGSPPEIFIHSYTSSNLNASYGESQEDWVHTREFVDRTCSDRIDDAACDAAKLATTPVACLAINLLSCGNLIYPTKNGVKLHRVCEQLITGENWLSEYGWNDKIHIPLGKKTHRLPPAHMLME